LEIVRVAERMSELLDIFSVLRETLRPARNCITTLENVGSTTFASAKASLRK
jgi:hypothetical protein